MSVITQEFSMLWSSSPTNGASGLTSFGNRFDITLNSPLAIPSNCYNPKIALVNANVWNSASNISPAFNNNVLRLVLGGVELILALPSGLYSLSAINSYLSNQLVLNGYASNRIAFDANYATSQVGAYLTVVGDQIDFSIANSIGAILGFSPIVITCAIANTYIFSSGKAQLNRVNSFLIASSLMAGKGIPLNANASSVIASIPITAGPNELITYTPNNLTFVDLSHLKGGLISNFNVSLLDQNRRDVDTNGENFDVLVKIMWDMRI